MNNRFRFRVWDTVNRRYAEFIYEYLYEYLTMPNRCVVEQSTGLKDVIGRLIYEGDIISATTFDGHNRQFIVKYVNEDACFGLFITKSMYISFNKVYDDSLQIIGNIHENPELLEDK